MDTLPPTLEGPPAIVRGTGLSSDMIGWHRCWQFLDHGRLGAVKHKPTNQWGYQKADEKFPNLIDDKVDLPTTEYGDLMYISAVGPTPSVEEEVRRRVFISKNDNKNFFFLNQYFFWKKFIKILQMIRI